MAAVQCIIWPDMKTNVLHYHDNLEIMRNHIPDESVDLVYLDPPFNSQADYNVLSREEVEGMASKIEETIGKVNAARPSP